MSGFLYLFSPLKIGQVVVSNRINFAAHLTNLSQDHKVSEAQIDYYTERAKGGCGLITTEELTVHPSDLAYEKLIDAFKPEVVPGFKKLTSAVHRYHTRIFAQLNHNGMQADSMLSRLPLWGPSAGKDPLFREVCKKMEIEDILECIEYFAKSAVHVVEGGFDGIELQLGHSSLIRQFMSPATNFRRDQYGGNFDNRLKIALDIIGAIRRAVGDSFTVGIRLNADEMHPKGGITHEMAGKIARRLEATGQIDFIDTSLGTFHNLFLVEGSMHTPLAYAVPLSASLRSQVSLPVYASNRINDPHLAEKILVDGHGDMVNMVRGLIADPELPNKARYGRFNDIRHCIACNQGCIGRMGMGYTIGCMQTPAAGEEKIYGTGTIKRTAKPKKVLIVGAGPAGLETARVAAQRKHQVIILEKNQEVGGQNLIAGKAAGRSEITGVTRWLGHQVRNLGVDIRLGVEATAQTILDEKPDAVVITTGSIPRVAPFPGNYDYPEVVNTWQVLDDEVETGERVLLIDLQGHHQGTGTAEFLADRGKSVHIIVPSFFPGALLGPLQDLFLTRQRLEKKGISYTPNIVVLEINGTVVKGLDVYSEEIIGFNDFDTVVLCAGNSPHDGLYFALKGKVPEIYRAGDCVAPRLTDMAIKEGHCIGRIL